MKRPSTTTLVALGLAFVYFALLWATTGSVGFTRDEGYYFKAAQEYSGWWEVLFSSRFWEAFDDVEIQKHFSYNTEHPPLVKLSQGVAYHLFHNFLGVASPSTGFRIAGFFWAALSVFATYLLGRRLVSAEVGLFAAAAMVGLPRYFFDAHLACFDVAITAMWTLSLWAFHRAWTSPPERIWRRSVLAGLVFGLALATKLNALFLPFVFVALWWLAPRERARPAFGRGPAGGPEWSLPRVPVPLLVCAVLGPVVFVATWPHLWHDTFERIAAYIRFHMKHEHYPISYFGELLVEPPFPVHFPFVMSAITIPAPLWMLGLIGWLASVWGMLRRRALSDGLVVLATLLPLVLIALPSSPIFGGVKHWFNAMPTLFVAGGAVLFQAVERLRSALPKVPRLAVPALVLLPGLLGLWASHPHGIGYYNALVGGYRGGAELGMQRGFWGGLAGESLDTLETLPPGSRVFFNRLNWDSFRMYQREERFSNRVSYANEARFGNAGIAFEQPEHGEATAEIIGRFGPRPVAGTYQDGVTLTQIYVEGRSSQAPPPE